MAAYLVQLKFEVVTINEINEMEGCRDLANVHDTTNGGCGIGSSPYKFTPVPRSNFDLTGEGVYSLVGGRFHHSRYKEILTLLLLRVHLSWSWMS
jgi:hypothetical protein